VPSRWLIGGWRTPAAQVLGLACNLLSSRGYGTTHDLRPHEGRTRERNHVTIPKEVPTQSFLNILIGVGVSLALLYWAKAVLIPVALALLLTFLLTPIVTTLWHWGLNRALAAVLVVVLATGLLGAVGWTVEAQLAALAAELPTYTANIKQKIAQMRHAGTGGVLGKVQDAVQDVSTALQQPGAPATPVPVQAEGPSLLGYLPSVLETGLTAFMVLVLVIFLLIEQGTLRDRLLTFGGYAQVTRTTKALDEAGARISGYLRMQALVNGSFGLLFGLGLFVVGLPYAVLWGFLAAVLRFIPYVGTLVAALLPIGLSLAVFPGWTQLLVVSGLFVLLELGTSSGLEPVLFGHSAGISQVAILVAVLFWSWLWGPVGLLLSTPLTVCLSVLGKYVSPLAFLRVVLTDESVEGLNTYYQRLVARDQDEAAVIVEAALQTQPLVDVYDTVLLPALSYAKEDRQRGILTDADVQDLVQATREIVEDLATHPSAAAPDAGDAAEEAGAPRMSLVPVPVLGCPARDDVDALALRMLQQACDPTHVAVDLLPPRLLTFDVLARVAQTSPALLCLGAVAPGGVPHLRYLCKQLRARFPSLPLVVGCWGAAESVAETVALLRADGLDHVGTTVQTTRDYIMQVCQLVASQRALLPEGDGRPDSIVA
jgi:predicted PurR-regulated permease PerM